MSEITGHVVFSHGLEGSPFGKGGLTQISGPMRCIFSQHLRTCDDIGLGFVQQTRHQGHQTSLITAGHHSFRADLRFFCQHSLQPIGLRAGLIRHVWA